MLKQKACIGHHHFSSHFCDTEITSFHGQEGHFTQALESFSVPHSQCCAVRTAEGIGLIFDSRAL